MLKELFIKHINENFSFLKNGKSIIAVSGGLDSMVLLHLTQAAKLQIAVASCNFNLRGAESDGDSEFVKEYSQQHSIQMFATSFDTLKFATEHKLSTQMAARELRYLWFEEIRQENNFNYILTAHHLDDNLETFLINLSRGSGIDGLIGIPAISNAIIRPILPFSREQILEYALLNNIVWREDSSNTDNHYLRNSIRQKITPELKNLTGNFLQSFQNSQTHLQQTQSMARDASVLVYKQVVEVEEKRIKIKLSELLRLENYQAYLYDWLHSFGFTAWQDIYNLVGAQSGKIITSPFYNLLKDREYLILYKSAESSNYLSFYIANDVTKVNNPINLEFSYEPYDSKLDSNCIFVDREKLHFPLELRGWREGDYIIPLGMTGKKKLSKFFKDEKIAQDQKEKTWLLLSNGEIVWVINHRLDDRFKVTSNTTQILRIKLT
ncbi:tRNA lysidine(34) synthetase TilS [Flavobacterium ardleyense]|uniref:tRNA lysidine(34) synthetase TilS n=1 Tax=Flavobacterium ardleyense TaxID=2038737 RepID=UPI00298C2D58|nr:tRNA lysidine(34) synthetase TilS [Flavobacterium ardleyense]